MSKTAEEQEILKVWYSRNPVHEINADTGKDMFDDTMIMCMKDYANIRSKELQEDLRVTENVKLSYLQAYNRECKRVDELTEEVANKQERIQALEKIRDHYEKDIVTKYGKIAELEGLLKELHERTLYQLGPGDNRITHAPYALHDKIVRALKL